MKREYLGFILFSFLSGLFIYIYLTKYYKKKIELFVDSPQSKISFPRIVHLIYIPWKKNGVLKSDFSDFDHSFYTKFKSKHPNWSIRLWKLPDVQALLRDHYPQYQNIFTIIKHPIQLIDFLRLLIIYKYGGIFWQYESRLKCNLNRFIPRKKAKLILFVETIISQTFADQMSKEPIRNNKPEELVRIAFGCFSSYPAHPFIHYCIEKSWKNILTKKLNTQYDILYIGGNAMFSEAYHEYPTKDDIQLRYDTKKYIQFSSKGSWRLPTY
jgi:mannosyltransferase OCH1-like enzyme